MYVKETFINFKSCINPIFSYSCTFIYASVSKWNVLYNFHKNSCQELVDLCLEFPAQHTYCVYFSENFNFFPQSWLFSKQFRWSEYLALAGWISVLYGRVLDATILLVTVCVRLSVSPLPDSVWVNGAMASAGFYPASWRLSVCVFVCFLHSVVAALQFVTFWQQLLQLNPKVALLSNRTAFSLTNAQFCGLHKNSYIDTHGSASECVWEPRQ